MLNSLNVLRKCKPIDSPFDWNEINGYLKDGIMLVTGKFLDSKTPGLRFVVQKIDDIIYVFRMPDTDDEQIKLVPNVAVLYNDKAFAMTWQAFLRDEDFIIADTDYLIEADIYWGDLSHDMLKTYLHKPENSKTLCYLNDNRE